jgi:hypothetical protein
MAAGDMTTLDRVKRYLKITQASAADAVLQDLITSASAWIKSYLNRDILQATYTETLDGTGTRMITVGQYPVTALTALTVNSQDLMAYAVTDGRRAIRLKSGGGVFTKDLANVVVTYTAGFVTTPADLEQACVELVAWRFTESGRVQQVSKSIQGEVVAYSMAAAPANVITILNNWRKVVA